MWPAAVVVLLLATGALVAMTINLMHHDPANCRVCSQRRAEERTRRADDTNNWR